MPDRHDPGYFERMSETEFAALFGDTPLERPGLAGMRRNWKMVTEGGVQNAEWRVQKGTE